MFQLEALFSQPLSYELLCISYYYYYLVESVITELALAR